MIAPSTGELAAVLDELLAPVAEVGELLHERVRVDHGALPHDDGLGVDRAGTEALQQCPHAGNDHRRTPFRLTQPPQQLEPLTHRLHRRTHPLERERLPGRHHRNLVRLHELGEVVTELAGHRAGGARDHERLPM